MTRRIVLGIAGALALVIVSATVALGAVPAKTVQVAHVKVSGTALPALPDTGQDPSVGTKVPTLTGKTFAAKKIVVPPASTEPQVVMFLAHWCPHCQAEVPRIVQLAAQGGFNGVHVTAVATGTLGSRPNYPPSKWLKREHFPFAVMVDSRKSMAAQAWGLTAYPFLVFVDASGKVAGRITGEVSPADLRTIVSALVAGRPLPIVGTG